MTERPIIPLNIFTSLHRPNSKKYINRAKNWTMKQMGGDALKAEKWGWERVGGGHQFLSENISSSILIERCLLNG